MWVLSDNNLEHTVISMNTGFITCFLQRYSSLWVLSFAMLIVFIPPSYLHPTFVLTFLVSLQVPSDNNRIIISTIMTCPIPFLLQYHPSNVLWYSLFFKLLTPLDFPSRYSEHAPFHPSLRRPSGFHLRKPSPSVSVHAADPYIITGKTYIIQPCIFTTVLIMKQFM